VHDIRGREFVYLYRQSWIITFCLGPVTNKKSLSIVGIEEKYKDVDVGFTYSFLLPRRNQSESPSVVGRTTRSLDIGYQVFSISTV